MGQLELATPHDDGFYPPSTVLDATALGPRVAATGARADPPPSPRWQQQNRLNEQAVKAAAAGANSSAAVHHNDDLVDASAYDRGAGDEDTHTSRSPVYHRRVDLRANPSCIAEDFPCSLYKTELCRSYEETGCCRYGAKCQFAHGQEELRAVFRHPRFKTQNCRTFTSTGTCPYGSRCRFIHYRGAAAASAAATGGRQLVVTVPAFPSPSSPKTPSPGAVQLVATGVTSASPPASPRSSSTLTALSDYPSPRSDTAIDKWYPEVLAPYSPPSPSAGDSARSHHRLPIFETLVPEAEYLVTAPETEESVTVLPSMASPKANYSMPGSPKSPKSAPSHKQQRHHGRVAHQGGAGRNRTPRD